MEEHYLFLSSQNCKDLRPNNIASDFTVELPQPYTLEGVWECGLKEIDVSLKEEMMYVCSDICRESYAENTLLPVLRLLPNEVKGKKRETYLVFEDPFYVRIKADTLTRVRIFIRGGRLQHIDSDSSTTRCTLHLRKWK
ncbi:hypothetical protein BOW52_10365 [Solemya elarraichensis gill symbiont]|uniref:Uncharacterized protein n=1 Tax=Solemya elarraichensis gill symbiont TaxID=1918949 RepID=A0A1T2KWF6_9GAMM|nr:hypothetical protein BOW52_10365 [Solemya elarraichensis gill symbiont]